MSNFILPAFDPVAGVVRNATWIDDYFGAHQYGVQFDAGGPVYRPGQPTARRDIPTYGESGTGGSGPVTDAATIAPEAEPLRLEVPRETLWVTDAELIRRLGVPEKVAREAIRALDQNAHSGFPPKQKFWGDRRYWPAVRAYLDVNFGLRVVPSANKRGQYD